MVWDVNTKKIVTVAWHKLCSPLKEGGLGIRSVRALIDAAILKLSWEIFSSDASWAGFLRARFFKFKRPIVNYLRSSLWPGVKRFISIVQSNSTWLLGFGNSINFSKDQWLSKPIGDLIAVPESLQHGLSSIVSDFTKDGARFLPNDLCNAYPDLAAEIRKVKIPLSSIKDQLIWKETISSLISFKDAFQFLNPAVSNVPTWCSLILETLQSSI